MSSEVEKYVSSQNSLYALSGHFVIVSWPDGHKKLCSASDYASLTSKDLLGAVIELPWRFR